MKEMTPVEIVNSKRVMVSKLKRWTLVRDVIPIMPLKMCDEFIEAFADLPMNISCCIDDIWDAYVAYRMITNFFPSYTNAEAVSFADISILEFSMMQAWALEKDIKGSINGAKRLMKEDGVDDYAAEMMRVFSESLLNDIAKTTDYIAELEYKYDGILSTN